ncbi:MAG TPA: HAMP domain-containing protein [Pseudonocardiaceae bacterium]|nr:HAMP domain-containing protein [Pseudonocardiaceae bacterium]
MFLARLLSAMSDVRDGNFRRRLTPIGDGLSAQVATMFNEIVERNQDLVGELAGIRMAAGDQGRLGERLDLDSSSGGWSLARESVNGLIEDLLYPTTELSRVLAAVAEGDLSQRMTAQRWGQPLRGESAQLCSTVNGLLDQLSVFAEEVTRVGREIGTEGKLGGLAKVPGVAGTWKNLTDNVNLMASNLTAQVRDISRVATAVADGDLSKKITVEVSGEMLGLKNTVNTMVDQLSAFADEVTRVAREVGTEGQLGGQARVPGVAGIWRDLTDNVNFMAGNLTSQVRSIAQVTTAVARGDLSQKITVDVKGEILELKNTVNTMVDQLSAFADEVTRVAREVGTEGQLGGQARVPGVAGTWQWLTESVNKLAGNLTTQVRAIAAVATAVTAGDLSQQITVETKGEMADLKDNINRMIGNLKETTRANQEQDWLKTNLARLSGLMQGQRDPHELAALIMSELTPLVSAQQGMFFLAENDTLRLLASYGVRMPDDDSLCFRLGESLVGQSAKEKKTIQINSAPPDYIRISSGLGSAPPADVIVLPLLFEGSVLGVIELATVTPFTAVHRDLLEQLKETIGVTVNTILASSRTDALLAESQRLAQELGEGSAKLQAQQKQLQMSNRELAEKAAQLAKQNSDIELKNKEIEQGRQELEERAKQLSLASKYKSEFMANMSHELRTPLNSLLILAKLLADNLEGNLTDKQVEFASTIHAAGSDLLQLIDDILDLAKVEAGHVQLEQTTVSVADVVGYVESLCRPLTAEKGLDFAVVVDPDVPQTMYTDVQRLQQILHNLLSNAVKFTPEGTVRLTIRPADPDDQAPGGPRIAFAVEDTGIGIPEDKLDVIFEAFQQADGTTSRKYGGTGLGLSISRELTQLLGGDLRVASAPGEGTTFVLTVPMTPPPVTQSELDRATAEEQADQSDGPRRFHGERVLIVDDDLRNVFALSTVLEMHGLRVVLADNGVSGIRALEQYDDIALVLMDIMMPELDGNATIAAIRGMSAHADLPVIAVTAKAMKGDREKSLESGATDYVPKPVDTDRLLNLIAGYLEADLNNKPAET